MVIPSGICSLQGQTGGPFLIVYGVSRPFGKAGERSEEKECLPWFGSLVRHKAKKEERGKRRVIGPAFLGRLLSSLGLPFPFSVLFVRLGSFFPCSSCSFSPQKGFSATEGDITGLALSPGRCVIVVRNGG